MLQPQDSGDAWAWRSELWARRSIQPTSTPKGRRRAEPLILCGHGVALKVEGGSLLVRNGFTHHPQKREEFRFFKGGLDTPTQIVMVDGSGHVTFDVLNWLAEQSIALTRISWNGDSVSVAAPGGFSANPFRTAWQRETRNDPESRIRWCVEMITRKIESAVVTLEKAIPKSAAWEKAMNRAYADLSTLELDPPRDIDGLRIIEANSAAAYFRAWKAIPLRWRGLSRRPIPETWQAIGSRTSDFNLAGNRNASHPVNAMLNYTYATLESRMRIQAIAEGYDPTIGIMHESRPGASAFIFDIMEPERAKVDRTLIEFVRRHTFDPADFTFRPDGVVMLNPQLARTVAATVNRQFSLLS
jgi:CRISPR-associated protein Cas1